MLLHLKYETAGARLWNNWAYQLGRKEPTGDGEAQDFPQLGSLSHWSSDLEQNIPSKAAQWSGVRNKLS